MAGTQAKGASHTDAGWNCPPESLTLEKNPASPFYSEDINEPLPEGFIDNIAARGVICSVCVVRDGERFVVTDGRKRLRALLEANKRRHAEGQPAHTIGYFIKRTRGDSDIIGLSAAANLHVDDSPMLRARKALRMQEAGAGLEQIANDFGVTVQCVKNWLTLLDCAAPVQKAVDEGRVGESIARKLAGLDREKQREVFDEMVAKGQTRGAGATRAVAAGKRGQPVAGETAKKMRSRAQIEAVKDALAECDGELNVEGRAARNMLRWIFRECEAGELCEDVAAVLVKERGGAEARP